MHIQHGKSYMPLEICRKDVRRNRATGPRYVENIYTFSLQLASIFSRSHEKITYNNIYKHFYIHSCPGMHFLFVTIIFRSLLFLISTRALYVSYFVVDRMHIIILICIYIYMHICIDAYIYILYNIILLYISIISCMRAYMYVYAIIYMYMCI